MSDKGNPNGYPTRDWSTRLGAEALAESITSHWARQGKRVQTWVFESAPNYFAVRTNLVAGLPPVQQKAVRQ